VPTPACLPRGLPCWGQQRHRLRAGACARDRLRLCKASWRVRAPPEKRRRSSLPAISPVHVPSLARPRCMLFALDSAAWFGGLPPALSARAVILERGVQLSFALSLCLPSAAAPYYVLTTLWRFMPAALCSPAASSPLLFIFRRMLLVRYITAMNMAAAFGFGAFTRIRRVATVRLRLSGWVCMPLQTRVPSAYWLRRGRTAARCGAPLWRGGAAPIDLFSRLLR